MSDKITGTLHEVLHACVVISCSFLLRMKKVSDNSCEKSKTHINCSILLFQKLCLFGMWTDTVEPDRLQMTV